MAVALPEYGLSSSRSFHRGAEGNSGSTHGRTSLAVREALAQSQFWRHQEDLREVLSGSMYRTRYVSIASGELRKVDARRIADDEEDTDWW